MFFVAVYTELVLHSQGLQQRDWLFSYYEFRRDKSGVLFARD